MDIADQNSTQAGPFLSLIQPSSLGPRPGTARTCVCPHLDCRHCRLLYDSYPLKLFKQCIYVINTVHSHSSKCGKQEGDKAETGGRVL